MTPDASTAPACLAEEACVAGRKVSAGNRSYASQRLSAASLIGQGLLLPAIPSTQRGFKGWVAHCKMPRLAESPTSRPPGKFNRSTVWKASVNWGHRKYGNELQGRAADIDDLMLDIGRNDDGHVASKSFYLVP